jgi:hypothetical protein
MQTKNVKIFSFLASVIASTGCSSPRPTPIPQPYTIPDIPALRSSDAVPLDLLTPGDDWVLAVAGDTAVEWFHRPSRVRRGHIVQVWTIMNFRTRSREGWSSMKTQNEIDCSSFRHRNLAITTYTDWNGRGRAIFSGVDPSPLWRPVAPETAGAESLRVICRS